MIRLFKTEDTHLVPPWRKSRSSVNNVKSLIYYKMKLIHHSKARSEFELINDIIIIITHNAIRYFKTEDTHLSSVPNQEKKSFLCKQCENFHHLYYKIKLLRPRIRWNRRTKKTLHYSTWGTSEFELNDIIIITTHQHKI